MRIAARRMAAQRGVATPPRGVRRPPGPWTSSRAHGIWPAPGRMAYACMPLPPCCCMPLGSTCCSRCPCSWCLCAWAECRRGSMHGIGRHVWSAAPTEPLHAMRSAALCTCVQLQHMRPRTRSDSLCRVSQPANAWSLPCGTSQITSWSAACCASPSMLGKSTHMRRPLSTHAPLPPFSSSRSARSPGSQLFAKERDI